MRSSDGSFIVSASQDKTLKFWGVASGDERGILVLPGHLVCLATHDLGLVAVCGDRSGVVYRVDLLGIRVGPPVVTVWSETVWSEPVRRWLFWRRRRPAGKKLAVGCPLCRVWSEVPASALGTELPCPNCGQRMKLNPFTIDADWHPVAAAWRGSGG